VKALGISEKRCYSRPTRGTYIYERTLHISSDKIFDATIGKTIPPGGTMKAAGTKRATQRNSVTGTRYSGVSRSVPALPKEQWLRTYTRQVLKVWLGRQSPLGLTPAYAQSIRKDLAQFYEQPLMRAFIEQTY
jgi:hypothetical protein